MRTGISRKNAPEATGNCDAREPANYWRELLSTADATGSAACRVLHLVGSIGIARTLV